MSKYQKPLKALKVKTDKNGTLEVFTPIDGASLGKVREHGTSDVHAVAKNAQAAFLKWRNVPAPARGEFVRLFGEELRAAKEDLGRLVTIECGKIYSEGLGEVQEMIDICDYAVGLSRQLYGLTMPSERPQHHMRETWQPLGPVGIISAFNFPVAVWSWNAAISLVCGDSIVWKPSEKTPLTALACQNIFDKAAEKFKAAGHTIPDNLSQVLIGQREIGEAMVDNNAFKLISATGSTRMGFAVGQATAKDIYDDLIPKLTAAYKQVRIGNPLDDGTLVGPLIDEQSAFQMTSAIAAAKEQGGTLLAGGKPADAVKGGFYMEPALVEMRKQSQIVKDETFAPILYVMKYKELDDAIELQNAVPQGLSSAIFTMNMREAERFLSASGSDCGIANVNIGTSGAEIGGAFGGEKETGGGRESGSDAWKAYMRRQTQTINYSDELPLAQGVKFEL